MLKLWFDMSNNAFDDTGATECARILRDLASRIARDGAIDWMPIFDVNGNKIGEIQMSRVELG